jgi:hypothetical protein
MHRRRKITEQYPTHTASTHSTQRSSKVTVDIYAELVVETSGNYRYGCTHKFTAPMESKRESSMHALTGEDNVWNEELKFSIQRTYAGIQRESSVSNECIYTEQYRRYTLVPAQRMQVLILGDR